MISIFALGSDLPEIEVIRSALSEERTLSYIYPQTVNRTLSLIINEI